jgi:hypothetical protein
VKVKEMPDAIELHCGKCGAISLGGEVICRQGGCPLSGRIIQMNPTVKSDNPISTFKARSYEHMAEVLAESRRQAEALKKAEEIKNKEA